MQARHLESIQKFEGFSRQAKWDYAQNSNGFGTRALHPGEQITLAEAKRRFAAEIEQARSFVEKHAAGWDEGTKAALTSLTFNAGTKWATSGLGEAVRSHDIDAVRSRFLAYTKAGGDDLPGLVRRRLAEAAWIGETNHESALATAVSGEPATLSRAPTSPLRSTILTADKTCPEQQFSALDGNTEAARANPMGRLPATAWWLMFLDLQIGQEREVPREHLADRSREVSVPARIETAD